MQEGGGGVLCGDWQGLRNHPWDIAWAADKGQEAQATTMACPVLGPRPHQSEQS